MTNTDYCIKRIATRILDLIDFGGSHKKDFPIGDEYLMHERDIPHRDKYLNDLDTQSQNAWFKNHGAPDGLPIPPPELVYIVTGQWNIAAFYYNGVQGAVCIKSILEKNGLNINAFESILDFGCGCGRIMRHWKTLRGPKLYGTDYNPQLVEWCQESLTFAKFSVNGSSSRLDYEDKRFDFIYAISVFTHLAEKIQTFLVKELTRILKPGGYLFISVNGPIRLGQLTAEQRQEFESGKLIVVNEEYSGTNHCCTFHPEKYVRETLCERLNVVDFVLWGAQDANQDVFLLQKPSKSYQ